MKLLNYVYTFSLTRTDNTVRYILTSGLAEAVFPALSTMDEESAVQFERKYLHSSVEEDIDSSDDSEVRVANMNRHSDNVNPEHEEENEEKSNSTNAKVENEIESDDEYTYSEDSIYSDDSCKDSEVTNVTPRSSLSAGSPLNRTMSLEFPLTLPRDEIKQEEITFTRHRFENDQRNLLRMCSSANDNRYSINNEHHQHTFRTRIPRRNMSFTNAEMRKIERENQFLLKKIMAQQKPHNKPIRVQSAEPRISSSAINRRKLQRRIEEENMMLLRRIQGAKPCALSTNATPGYRVTSL